MWALEGGQSVELRGGRVILTEEKYNLKHSNNLRLKKVSSYRVGVLTIF